MRLAACAGAAAILQIDGTLVVVALPSVGRELGVGPHAVSWIITAYFLSFGLMLFPGGRLVDRFGSRMPAFVGLTIFAGGATIGALSESFSLLVASRVVQGVGAGLVSPASLAGAVSAFSPDRRGVALGIWGATSGVANILGPLLGGLLTVGAGWRANWWVLLPLSFAAATAVVRSVPKEVRTDERPDVAELGKRTIGAATAVAGLTFMVMIGAFFLAQQYLQQSADFSALGAGAILAIVALFVVVASPAAGRWADKSGEQVPGIVGFALCGIGLAVIGANITGPAAPAMLLPVGLGLGLLFAPASRAAMNAVPMAKHGRIAALMSASRLLGAAAGSALAGVAIAGGATAHHVQRAFLVGAAICVLLGLPAAAGLSRPQNTKPV